MRLARGMKDTWSMTQCYLDLAVISDLRHGGDHVIIQGEPLQLGQPWQWPALDRSQYLYQNKTNL